MPGSKEVYLPRKPKQESARSRSRQRSPRRRSRSRGRGDGMSGRQKDKKRSGSPNRERPSDPSGAAEKPNNEADDDVIEVAPEPKAPHVEIQLSSEDEEQRTAGDDSKSPRSRSRTDKTRPRLESMQDLRDRLKRRQIADGERRARDAQRARERSEERRRLREERWRLEEERREIKNERHRIMSIRQEKERDSAWMDKSNDFLKKLGIPLEGTSQQQRGISLERESAYSVPPPPLGRESRGRSPSPPVIFGRHISQQQRSFSPDRLSPDRLSGYNRGAISSYREVSPSNAAFFIGDQSVNHLAIGRETMMGRSYSRSLSPKDQLFTPAGARAFSSAMTGSGSELRPIFGKAEPAAMDRTSLAALGDSVYSLFSGRETARSAAAASTTAATGSRMSGLSSLKQAVSRMMNQSESGQDIDMRAEALAVNQLTADILRPGTAKSMWFRKSFELQ